MRRGLLGMLFALVVSSAACAQPVTQAPTDPSGSPAAAPTSSDAGSEQAASSIVVSSPAFADGGSIPEPYSCLPQDGPPQLEWTGVPPEAVEVAIIMDDVTGQGQLHWIVAGLDPATTRWPDAPDAAGIEIKEYFGPCPSTRSEYRFRVLALDEPSGLAAGDPERSAAERLEAASVAHGQLIGYYP
jgi:phosphatidylethanolamine-binding protein (PEBP) family uncharacterized protein